MVNIVRQDKSSLFQKYHLHLGKNTNWELVYTSNVYPCKKDKEPGEADESIFIKERFPSSDEFKESGSFHDVIYLNDGKIGINLADSYGYSPVFDGWADLELKVKDEFVSELSPEAKDLLQKGLEYYDSIKKG